MRVWRKKGSNPRRPEILDTEEIQFEIPEADYLVWQEMVKAFDYQHESDPLDMELDAWFRKHHRKFIQKPTRTVVFTAHITKNFVPFLYRLAKERETTIQRVLVQKFRDVIKNHSKHARGKENRIVQQGLTRNANIRLLDREPDSEDEGFLHFHEL